jgi:hypothetical protein
MRKIGWNLQGMHFKKGSPKLTQTAKINDFATLSINTLHIAYWYDGDYPQERVEEEFDRWHREVSAFIEGLRRLKGA